MTLRFVVRHSQSAISVYSRRNSSSPELPSNDDNFLYEFRASRGTAGGKIARHGSDEQMFGTKQQVPRGGQSD
jgi:hypothetical protein